MTGPVPWLNRVRIVNYKSIADCDVILGPLTVLVGPNGAGKSNFLDALAFLGEAVATTPHQAAETRGGMGEILRRVPERAEEFAIAVEVTVPWGPEEDQWARGTYGFKLRRSVRAGRRPVEVVSERCSLRWKDKEDRFSVEKGQVDNPGMPFVKTIEADRLYLPVTSAQPNYTPLFGALRNMRFYNLDPHTLRLPRPESDSGVLGRLGEHLGDVIGQLADSHPEMKRRYDDYLTATVPGVVSLDRKHTGSYVTVELSEQMPDGVVGFGPDAMSDGTIRAAGVLAALFQPWTIGGSISLVGIEEPEIALHPGAAGVLFDALTEASERVQVIATSQSADLLDRDDATPEMVRVVTNEDGLTVIGELDDASRAIVGERRLTLGELMRANQLQPNIRARPGGFDDPVGGLVDAL